VGGEEPIATARTVEWMPSAPNYKVVVLGPAVTESDPDPVIIQRQGCERDAKSEWNRGSSGHEGFVQSDASHRETGTDLKPEVVQIGLAKLRPCLVIKSPAADHRGRTIGDRAKAERPQNSHAIRGQIDPRSYRRPRLGAFDELSDQALSVQRSRDREPRDPSSHD
jgi:hypothetical protein